MLQWTEAAEFDPGHDLSAYLENFIEKGEVIAMLKQKIQRFATGAMALFMTASSGFSYAVPVYAEEVTTAGAKKKQEEELTEDEDSTLKLNENSRDEEEFSLKKEAEDERMIEKILIAQHNGANLYVSKADQERLKTATKGNEDIPESGKTKEKSARFYKSRDDSENIFIQKVIRQSMIQ